MAKRENEAEKPKKKKKLASGIRQRWARTILSVVAAVVVLAGIAFTLANGIYTYSTMRSGLEAEADTTTAFLRNYLNLDYNECYASCVLLVQNYARKDRLELQFVDESGHIVASSYGLFADERVATDEIPRALSTRSAVYFVGQNPLTDERIMSVATPMIYSDGRVVGVLRFVTATRNADRFILLSLMVAMVAAGIMVGVVYLSSRMYLKSILVPVSEITETAKRIAGGSYGVQIQKKFDDEIGELADTINDMSNQISQSERMQSEFVSSVSHELRTPLTAIGGWAETLEYDEAITGESRRGVEIIGRETGRLTKMVEELLEFTRIQDGRFRLNMERMDIGAEVEDAVFTFSRLSQREELALRYDPPEDMPAIEGDPERLRQVLLNLLDNAVKYGRDGGAVEVGLSAQEGWVRITVRDHGPGIPPDELPHVKEKFYKGSGKERGSGIGLAVCDEIVARHGGQLSIANAPGGGVLATVLLPVNG